METAKDPVWIVGYGGNFEKVNDLRMRLGSTTDLLWTAMDRFADEKIAPMIVLRLFLIHKPCPCHSIADPLQIWLDPAMFLRIFFAAEASRT